MTSVQIGNYGVTGDDAESRGPQVAGFVMRESSPVASNWRADQTLREYLTTHDIVAIADIDTRALTRKLRSGGVLRGVIATGAGLDPQQLVARAAGIRADGRQRSGQGRDVRRRPTSGRRTTRATRTSSCRPSAAPAAG